VAEDEDEDEDDEEDEEDTHEEEEEEEEDEGGDDTHSLHSLPHSRAASPPSATHSPSDQSALSASQGDVLSPSDSSGTSSQVRHTADVPAQTIPTRRTSPKYALILSKIITFTVKRAYSRVSA